MQNTRQPRNRGRSFSLARWERVGVRVFRATNLGLRKNFPSATLHAALAPSHPSSTHRTAPTAPQNAPKPTLAVPRQKPASSPIALRETVETCPRRDPSVSLIRAPRLASPPSPQRAPKTSQKSAPNYLKSFLEETLPAHETAHSHPASRHPATSHPRSFGSSSHACWERVGVSVSPAPAPSPQPLPVRPPSAPDLTARPSALAPSSPPPPLKSFLEKTLTRAKPTHFTPPTAHSSSVPNTPHPTPMTGDNQLAAQLPGRTR